jgi:hypothetical protein
MTHRLLHELTEDLAICPTHVIAVKRGGTTKSPSATIFFVGQGQLEGFTVDMTWEEAVDSINSALSEMLPKEMNEDEDEDEDEDSEEKD